MLATRRQIPELTTADWERFFGYMEIDNPSKCWHWRGGLDKGYGYFRILNGRYRPHRVVYALVFGDPGWDLHHRCGNRACVNPKHLEPVVVGKPLPRHRGPDLTRCIHGHSFSDENTYICPRGWRQCRRCLADASARRRRERRQVRLQPREWPAGLSYEQLTA